MNMRREPSAELRAMASQFHQMFVALVQEGFTEAQALSIIGAVIARGGGEKEK